MFEAGPSTHWRALLVTIVAAAGCSTSVDADKPKTAAVHGVVLYNDAPMADATVTFHPKGGTRAAFAKTGPDGTFQLTTFDANDGAMPGDYIVTVSKVTDENEGPPSTDIAAPPRTPKMKSWLPAKYGDPKTSGLTFSVKADAENNATLKLVD